MLYGVLAIALVITGIQHLRHAKAARSQAPKLDGERIGV